jgi:hypothetical protein
MLFGAGRYKCKSKQELFIQSPATQYDFENDDPHLAFPGNFW